MKTRLESKGKERRFYTAKIDAIFKTIFVQESDHHMMEALLSQCLGDSVTIVKYSKVELDVKNAKERNKRLDVLVRVKDKFINVELNTNDDSMTRVRNFNFFTAFYSSKTNRGDSYDNEIDYIQINLSFNMAKSKPIMSTYVLKDECGDIYVKNFKIMEINMDKIKEEWYDNGRKGSKYQYLLMLDLDKRELKELSKSNDNIVREYMEKIEDLNSDVFVPPVSYEEDERLILEAYKKQARREGLREGIEEGIKKGTKKGIKQGIKEGIKEGIERGKIASTNEIAKKMLKANMDIKIITDITGLNEEELNKLK